MQFSPLVALHSIDGDSNSELRTGVCAITIYLRVGLRKRRISVLSLDGLAAEG